MQAQAVKTYLCYWSFQRESFITRS